jgi:hypothetical protein
VHSSTMRAISRHPKETARTNNQAVCKIGDLLCSM